MLSSQLFMHPSMVLCTQPGNIKRSGVVPMVALNSATTLRRINAAIRGFLQLSTNNCPSNSIVCSYFSWVFLTTILVASFVCSLALLCLIVFSSPFSACYFPGFCLSIFCLLCTVALPAVVPSAVFFGSVSVEHIKRFFFSALCTNLDHDFLQNSCPPAGELGKKASQGARVRNILSYQAQQNTNMQQFSCQGGFA